MTGFTVLGSGPFILVSIGIDEVGIRFVVSSFEVWVLKEVTEAIFLFLHVQGFLVVEGLHGLVVVVVSQGLVVVDGLQDVVVGGLHGVVVEGKAVVVLEWGEVVDVVIGVVVVDDEV